MIVGILIAVILILIAVIIHKSAKFRELNDEYMSSFIYFSTFMEFIPCVAEHMSKEEILNDMTNAVKRCANQNLYDVKNIETGDTECYEMFAQQLLNQVMDKDKE